MVLRGRQVGDGRLGHVGGLWEGGLCLDSTCAVLARGWNVLGLLVLLVCSILPLHHRHHKLPQLLLFLFLLDKPLQHNLFNPQGMNNRPIDFGPLLNRHKILIKRKLLDNPQQRQLILNLKLNCGIHEHLQDLMIVERRPVLLFALEVVCFDLLVSG